MTEVAELKLQIANLKEKLKLYEAVEDKYVPKYNVQHLHKQPLNIDYLDYSPFHAITFTIDQRKYDLRVYTIDDLYGILLEAVSKLQEYCLFIYYCIEHTESGVPHLHLMVQYRYACTEMDAYNDIQPFLTDVKKNKRAYHLEGPATSKWKDYINKSCPYGFPKYWNLIIDDDWQRPNGIDAVRRLTISEQIELWRNAHINVINYI